MKSECFAGSSVSFPEFTGERVYMHEFIPSIGLPKELERWQKTVDAMLIGVNAPGSVYLMIDQAEVKAGNCHRRPGLHVDGYWYAGDHSPNPQHNPTPEPNIIPEHKPIPKHNPIPNIFPDSPRHNPAPTRHSMVGHSEALILASNVEGCMALEGDWSGIVDIGGDCDSIARDNLKVKRMLPGVVWLGETGAMLHSALELSANALRTVVRLNVPGWVPN